MLRTKTNFQAIVDIEKRWLSDSTIQPGQITNEVKIFVCTTLELESRNKMCLQDLRDFAVCYLTTKCTDRTDRRHDILWDCMSAITHIIDTQLLRK